MSAKARVHHRSVVLVVGFLLAGCLASIACAAEGPAGADAAKKGPGVVSATASPATAPAIPNAPAIGRRMLIYGWGLPFVAVIGADGQEEWRCNSGGAIDAWLLDDGAIVFGNGTIQEIRRDPAAKKGYTVVWERKPGGTPKGDEKPKTSECFSCQPLPENRILVGENGNGRVELIEIERGSMVEKFHIAITDPKFGGAHGLTRKVRKTARGTYLFTKMGKEGYEYDATGKLLRRFPDVGFELQQLPDGSYIGAGGDTHCVIGFDSEGKETWRIRKDDIPGFRLGLVAGAWRLEDGSLLVANWGGHTAANERPSLGPCVGRISADRKSLIGSFQTTPAHSICGVQVLPAPAERKATP